MVARKTSTLLAAALNVSVQQGEWSDERPQSSMLVQELCSKPWDKGCSLLFDAALSVTLSPGSEVAGETSKMRLPEQFYDKAN